MFDDSWITLIEESRVIECRYCGCWCTLFVTQLVQNLNYIVAFQLYSASVAVATVLNKGPLQNKNVHLFIRKFCSQVLLMK